MYSDYINYFTHVDGGSQKHIKSYVDQPITREEKHILVIWPGKLIKQKNESHQPKLYVLIQEIEIKNDTFELLEQYYLIKVPSSKPHEFSIGSIFRVNSQRFTKIGITYKEKLTFYFENAKTLSQYISPLDLNKCGFIYNTLINTNPAIKKYLIYDNLIKIKCKDSKIIYIPAMLFFTSYYGSSNEIHRLLLTRPYSYIKAFITKKVTSPQDSLYSGIHFNCDNDFTGLDAIFMNTMFLTEKHLESVSDTIYLIQNHDPKDPLELKPYAYFNDFTCIDAHVFPLGKNEYLISEIKDSSIPQPDKDTVTITTEIQVTKKEGGNHGNKNLPPSFRPNNNSDLDKKPLDSEAVAGHDSPKIVKYSAKTKYSSHVNNNKKIKPIKLHSSTSTPSKVPNIDTLATGEKYGTNKKTGKLIEHFGELKDTHKQQTIHNVYNACLYIKDNSTLIESVAVFNAETKTFIENPEKLTLVSFNQITKLEEPDSIIRSEINNWIRISKDNRGCCILRITMHKTQFYLLEIERKIKTDGKSERGSYKLFTFQIKNENKLIHCFLKIFKQLTKSRGRISSLANECTLNSKGFPHRQSKNDEIMFHNLVKNTINHHS